MRRGSQNFVVNSKIGSLHYQTEELESGGFVVEIQCSLLIGSSVASSTSTAYPADYNGPFHVWTKTDGGAESAIHPYRWVMAWGEAYWIVSKLVDTKTSGCS